MKNDTKNSAHTADEEVSVLELASVPLRRWRIVFGVPVLVGSLAAAISIFLPRWFTATTTFVPEANTQSRIPSSLAPFAALAGQAGISLGEPSQSPRFYADIVKSRELLERIVLSRYVDPHAQSGEAADSTTLLRILDVKGRNAADSLERAVKKLSKFVSVRVDVQTNIVHVNVESRDPRLSAAIAARIVEFLNDFNASKRQSRARERRHFVEVRVTDADRELQDAEDQLKHFYQRNRSWQQAPDLVFEEGRLRRRVEIRQEVSLTLKREYEAARIEEVNDTPVITVIDPPVPPQKKSSPKPTLLVILGVFLGAVVGLLWAFAADHLAEMNRSNPEEYRRFVDAAERMRSDLGRYLPFAFGKSRNKQTDGAS